MWKLLMGIHVDTWFRHAVLMDCTSLGHADIVNLVGTM